MIVASGCPPPSCAQNAAMLCPHAFVAPTNRHSPRKSAKARPASSTTASGRSSYRSCATHVASSLVTMRPSVIVSRALDRPRFQRAASALRQVGAEPVERALPRILRPTPRGTSPGRRCGSACPAPGYCTTSVGTLAFFASSRSSSTWSAGIDWSSSPKSPSHGVLQLRRQLGERRHPEAALGDTAAVVGDGRAERVPSGGQHDDAAAHAEADDRRSARRRNPGAARYSSVASMSAARPSALSAPRCVITSCMSSYATTGSPLRWKRCGATAR